MPIREQLPEALRLIMQNGMLERTFQDGLLPQFLYPAVGETRPWPGGMGDTQIFTRTGFLDPVTTPLNGADPSNASYPTEQYSMTMSDYGNSKDTDLLTSAMTLSSVFLENVQKLGVNAGQSLNRVTRDKLYSAYTGGHAAVVTAQGSASTTCVVDDATGFDLVRNPATNKREPVSGALPLAITIAGVANTVTGVNLATNTLTLGTAVVQTVGDAVLAANRPFVVNAGTADTAADLGASDVATFKLFRQAVTRLRRMNIPTIGGYYVAHVDSETEAQLFDDAEFKNALQGRVDSPIYQTSSIGRFAGIDWVRNEEAPTTNNGTVDVHQPIVVGGGALINGPFRDYVASLRSAGAAATADIREIGAGAMNGVGLSVALIIRPPQDKMQRVITSSWGWVGDFAVPTDASTGDAALYKRAVVVQHAG